jgi:hypothetical protein
VEIRLKMKRDISSHVKNGGLKLECVDTFKHCTEGTWKEEWGGNDDYVC